MEYDNADSPWQKDVLQWDVYNWSRALSFWEKHAELKPGMRALGIGERGGGLSLWLAKKGLQVTCTDYNSFPESTAQLHKRYGVDHQVSYEKQDATALDYPDATFDVVIIKSVLGALSEKERQQKAINEFYRVLKPGGQLLLAENAEATRFHGAVRKRFARWSEYWRYLHPQKDLDLFSAFPVKLYTSTGFWGFVGKGRLETPMRWADKLSAPFVPKSWHYIFIALFRK